MTRREIIRAAVRPVRYIFVNLRNGLLKLVRRKRPTRSESGVLLGLLVLGALAIFLGTQPTTNPSNPAEDTDTDVLTYTTDKPDENKPDKDNYNWKGKPTDAKYISLPSIKAEGFIQKVGVDQNKQVTAPNNVHVAGWFVDTVLPGQKGLSIIDAHVSGPTQPGVFKNLGKLSVDDKFTIEFGDGKSKQFKVFQKATVPEAEAAAILFNQDPTMTNQLNLITCAGKYNKTSRTFSERTVVYATLQQ